jgi:hypothetical protein
MAIRPGIKNSDRSLTRDAQVLRRLVSARICFFASGEGEFFKNGVERASGLVINQRGEVWSFWTGWDDARDEVVLAEWESVSPEPAWLEDQEYREAREALGLPL